MAYTAPADQKTDMFIAMTAKQLLHIGLVGVFVGLAAWGLAFLLDTYVYQAILCNGNESQCGSSAQYATITANILAASIGLFGLVRLQIFRPLLIVLAALAGLWSIVTVLQDAVWYEAGLWTTALYTASYALFGWIARIRSFLLTLIIMILIIVSLRLILTA